MYHIQPLYLEINLKNNIVCSRNEDNSSANTITHIYCDNDNDSHQNVITFVEQSIKERLVTKNILGSSSIYHM